MSDIGSLDGAFTPLVLDRPIRESERTDEETSRNENSAEISDGGSEHVENSWEGV